MESRTFQGPFGVYHQACQAAFTLNLPWSGLSSMGDIKEYWNVIITHSISWIRKRGPGIFSVTQLMNCENILFIILDRTFQNSFQN